MRIEINPRGNGACPLCAKNKSCRVQNTLGKSIESMGSSTEEELEIVVYSCPYFKEKVAL
jgi:hypothetical protein